MDCHDRMVLVIVLVIISYKLVGSLVRNMMNVVDAGVVSI